VAAELLAELGEPFGACWRLLVDAHGPREAARSVARVLGAIVAHGEAPVADALGQALAAERTNLLALGAGRPQRPASIVVPATLAAHTVTAASAATYDALLRAEEER
jgi:hypothetical protein